ncbi:hypothetical protein OAT14_00210 [Candidatus Pelagibacter ubique]|nr:hypothetical protein [Candidatus Pelagibacter ubique]
MSNKWKNKTEEEMIDYFESFEDKSTDMLETISNLLYLKKQLKECVSDEKRIFLLDNLSYYKAKLADLIKQKKGVK